MVHIWETSPAPNIPHQTQVHQTKEILLTLRHLHLLGLTDARMWVLYTHEEDLSDATEMPQPLSRTYLIGHHPDRWHYGKIHAKGEQPVDLLSHS